MLLGLGPAPFPADISSGATSDNGFYGNWTFAMRVGIDLLSERGTPGGIHTYTNELLAALGALLEERSGESSHLLVLAPDDYQFQFSVSGDGPIERIQVPWRGLPAAARRMLQAAFVPILARRHRLDLVHSVNNVLPAHISVPGVVTIHDLSAFVLASRFSLAKRTYLRWAVPRSARRATRVIAVSESTRRELLSRVPDLPDDRVCVVHEGAAGKFHPDHAPDTEHSVRERYRLPEQFALNVCRIEPGKNLDGLTRALRLLAEEGVRIPLVLVGSATPHLDVLRRAWTRRGLGDRIHYLGEVPADVLPHLYRMATVFVFPSLDEGFGLPVLEAMASGTAAVVSNASSLPEVAGDAALLVDPLRPEAIACALRRLWTYEPLRRLLSARGIERASGFSWQRAAEKTLEVYEEALRDASRGRDRRSPPTRPARGRRATRELERPVGARARSET